MSWTTPKTFVTGESLSAADLNTNVKDNTNALKSPPSDDYVVDEVANYTTASTSFVDVDGTNLSLSITTTGGDVMIGFAGAASNSGDNNGVYLDVEIDGNLFADDDGILAVTAGANYLSNMSFVVVATGLSPGSHTFKLQWKTTAGTSTMWAGAGTANLDVHPRFWIREI